MENQIFSNNLQHILNEKHISRTELSKKMNAAYTTVTDWINGKTIPRNTRLKKLAQILNVSIDELLTDHKPDNIYSVDGWKQIPVIGDIACGDPILAEENIEYYQAIPTNILPKNGDFFILHCKGNSMSPTIKNGSLVVIQKQTFVENGEIAAVLINNEATLKRVKKTDDQIILLPDNPEYDPIILNPNNDNRILGKAVTQLSTF